MNSKKVGSLKVGLFVWQALEISGTSTVIRNLLLYLNRISSIEKTKKGTQLEYCLILNQARDEIEDDLIAQLEKTDYQFKFIPQRNLQTKDKWLEQVSQELQHDGFALQVFFDLNVPVLTDKVRESIKTVVVVHDIMPLILPEYYLDPVKYWKVKKQYKNANQADCVVTVSDFSRNGIINRTRALPEKVVRIYNGLDNDNFNLPNLKEPEHWPHHRGRRGVLYVGDLRNRKNVYRLAKAYLRLPGEIREEHPLLLSSSGELLDKIKKLFSKQKVDSQLVLLGKTKYTSISELYRQGSIFVFPSIMEGFGLPVIEAQRHGIPVVCGHHSSLVEVGGGTVVYAKVTQVKDLSDKIRKLLEDRKLHARLVREGYENSYRFTAKKMAREYHEVFQKLLRKST